MKLQFTKNGQGRITSARINIPLIIARCFSGKEFDVEVIDLSTIVLKVKDKA